MKFNIRDRVKSGFIEGTLVSVFINSDDDIAYVIRDVYGRSHYCSTLESVS